MPEPRVLFELSNVCQLDCVHCFVAERDRTQSLPLDLYEDILSQVSSYGIRSMSFTGGEPTLHPQFADVLDIASRRGFMFDLITNGWNFPRTLPILRQYRQGLLSVTFSLDGAREETHDSLRGTGSYRSVLNAMDLCRSEGIPFYSQMVLTSRSYTEVEEMCDLVLEKGGKVLKFVPLAPTRQTAQQGLDLPPEKYVQIGVDTWNLAPKYQPRLSPVIFQGRHPPMPWVGCEFLMLQNFVIDAKGRLRFCANLARDGDCPPGPDMVADLGEVSFHEALRRQIQVVAKFHEDKSEAIKNGKITLRDANFPCWYCNKYFNKTDWLKQFPDNPWNESNGKGP